MPGGRAEVEGQWAYVAVLGEKGHTKESSNGRPYAMWCAPHPGSEKRDGVHAESAGQRNCRNEEL